MRNCWRSRDEFISVILLWTPSHGRAKVGRPARSYIQQLCVDTGYSLEDLPGAMDDRDGWRERVREILPVARHDAAAAADIHTHTHIYIYIYIYIIYLFNA